MSSLELPPTFTYEKRDKHRHHDDQPAGGDERLHGRNAARHGCRVRRLSRPTTGCWVAILTAAGDRSPSSSGMDSQGSHPAMLQSGDEIGYEDHTKRPFSDVFKPIVAAVNGFCIAGGIEFLQGTDLRIAADTATFGLGEVRWGIIPTGGSHVRLPRQIPWAVAMELLADRSPISPRSAPTTSAS
jgi:enoyl-CoA hydratase